MGLLRKVCIVFALLSAGVTESFRMSEGATGTGSARPGLADASSANEGGNTDGPGDTTDEVPLLPPADPNNQNIPRIKLGETITFEEFGPIILNTDGKWRQRKCWRNRDDLFLITVSLISWFF